MLFLIQKEISFLSTFGMLQAAPGANTFHQKESDGLHALIEQADFARNSGDRESTHRYPDKELRTVVAQVLEQNPETAFCFLNNDLLFKRARFLQQSFLPDYAHSHVTYAVKANPLPRILETLLAAGITNFDCASAKEIMTVIDLTHHLRNKTREGIKVLFNHPIKKKRDIQQAARVGISHFTVQSLQETEKILGEAGDLDNTEIAVRLETTNKNAAIDLSSKYGANHEEAARIFELLKKTPRVTSGISIHVGSQVSGPDAYTQGIKLVAKLLEKHGPFRTINLGGGFPVNYHPEENHDLTKFFEVINRDVERYLPEALEAETKFYIEPGRAMIAEAVDLMIPVLAREKRQGKECLYLDDGVFTSFSDAVVHGWKYHFRFMKADGSEIKGESEPCCVFGRTCDSGDKLGILPIPSAVAEGDYVWVPKAGAYLDCQSTQFNGFEPPKYVSYNPTAVIPLFN